MNDNFHIRKVAVLGAGVMGAQIAAHLVNANVETLLFELPAKEGDKNGNVNKALDGLKKLDPAPAASPAKISFIQPANYEQHLEKLRECDLVIEAIAERIDWKSDLYKQGRALCRRANDLCDQHLGPVDQHARRGLPGTICATVSAASTSSTRRATCTWSN